MVYVNFFEDFGGEFWCLLVFEDEFWVWLDCWDDFWGW